MRTGRCAPLHWQARARLCVVPEYAHVVFFHAQRAG